MNKLQKLAHAADRLLNPLKTVEVFGMFGPGNLGDEAMLVAARAHLPPHRHTSYQSYFRHPVLKGLLRHRPTKKLLVGGGTLVHGGKTGWLDYVEMRSRQGVDISFLGTGLAFLEDQIEGPSQAFERWSRVMAKAEHVYLRGPASVALAHRMCGRGEEFGDFAFLLQQPHLTVKDHDLRDRVIGINVGLCLGDQADFESKIAVIVRMLSDHFSIVFHAVVQSDVPVIYRVIALSEISEPSYRVELDFFDPFAFITKVRNYRAFIGLKLHAAGLALIAGVPALFVAYLPKCDDFVAPLGAGDELLVRLPLDLDGFVEKIDDLLVMPERYCRNQAIKSIMKRQRAIIAQIYGGR
jgi:hypothetical protein